MIEQFFLVLFIYIIIDIAYALYTKAVAQNKIIAASTWASILPVLTAFLVVQYIGNMYLVIPMMLGAFVGTYIALRWFN